MSGLYPEKDVILEVATIVTDPDLNVLAEGPVLAIYQTENIFNGMDEWNSKHHKQSGLIDRCRKSRFSIDDADQMTLDFIKPFTQERMNVLCGNSITQDRRFMYKYMLKELTFRWYPDLPEFKKQEKHQALDDIRESIAELAYYRKTIFKDKL